MGWRNRNRNLMEINKIEHHPFIPFLPEGAKIVMCGTFPPKQDKWSMDFFYPNFYNDMWRIFGLIFFDDKEHFFDSSNKTNDKVGIQEMLTQHKIGIGETATEVIRTKDNASDKFLEIVTPVKLPKLLAKVPECGAIVTTGEKAASVISTESGSPLPKMGEAIDCKVEMENGSTRYFRHWRMPSSSRAYPMKLDKKAAFYAEMLRKEGIIND